MARRLPLALAVVASAQDNPCPFLSANQRLSGLHAAAEPGSKQQQQIAALLQAGDEGLRALCCRWDGISDGPGDDGLCWQGTPAFGAFARCCFASLQRLARQPAPAWMRRELASDLEPWAKRGLAPADMELMQRRWGHVFCRFRIREGRLSTCEPRSLEVLSAGPGGEPWGQYEALAGSVRLLAELGLLPEGLDVFVSPALFETLPLPAPVLTKARAVFAPGHLRVPSYELFGDFLDRTRERLGAPLPWGEKLPQLYWRGGMRSFNACPCQVGDGAWPKGWRGANLSGLLSRQEELPRGPGGCQDLAPSVCKEQSACRCQRHVTNRSTLPFSNRARLCELSLRHPELLDARLSYVPEPTYSSIAKDLTACLAAFSRFGDHKRFRYLMSTDGSTIDDTRAYWMLSTGSLLFKQVTPLLPFGLPALRPWRHFVPVREDLQDLLEKLRWARSHDQEAQAMAERARAFAARWFTQEQLLHYLLRALLSYHDLKKPS